MRICFFGNYIPDYPRIVVLKKGFRQNRVQVLECHTRKKGILKYFELASQHRKLKHDYDILLVGMAGYTLVWFAKLLTRKPVVFDAFVSLNITTLDRGQGGFYFRFWDKLACRLADKVLLDTNTQIDYFVQEYNLPREKFIRVFVGTDDEVFRPLPVSDHPPQAWGGVGGDVEQKFIVHWHGHIVPFHGLPIVIQAADKLRDYKDIEFRITTRLNSRYEEIKKRVEELELANVKFFPETTYQGLAQAINEADIALGIFGNNLKAQVVIPNKIFEAVACGKPVITADTPAVREAFDEDSMQFCKPEDPKSLAEAILGFYTDEHRRKSLAEKAHRIYKNHFIPQVIASELLRQL